MKPEVKKLLVFAVLAVVLFVIIYLVIIKPKAKAKANTTVLPATGGAASGTASTDTSTGAGYSPDPSLFPLKMGSTGKPVEQLQEYLQYQYNAQFPQYGIDGNWGAETDANVQKYLNRDNVSLSAYNSWGLSSYLTTVYP